MDNSDPAWKIKVNDDIWWCGINENKQYLKIGYKLINEEQMELEF